MSRPRVEILYFEGCPNHEPARAMVERIAEQLRVEPEIELVEVANPETAVELRFLGSPTVRINGRDVEPGAEERRGFALSCRIYRGQDGAAEQPDESWVREALSKAAQVRSDGTGTSVGAGLPPGVAAALAAAEIPPSKLGSARRARLTEAERELYFWILRHFASDGRPSSEETRAAAHRLGIDAEPALATLAREDLVHRGSDGEITVAYPFSGRPTAHRVRFPNGHERDAMCAIDALGIAPMFGEPIEIASRDPVSGHAIDARVTPDGAAEWSPRSAVVVAGALDRQSESCFECCPVLNFFASPANAERWLAEHPQVRGSVISIEEATAAGRAVFGEVLRQS
jgi:hypothetical protein